MPKAGGTYHHFPILVERRVNDADRGVKRHATPEPARGWGAALRLRDLSDASAVTALLHAEAEAAAGGLGGDALVFGDLGYFETDDVVEHDGALLLRRKHREQALHLTAREVGLGRQALFGIAQAFDQGLFQARSEPSPR
jgi:hypothetical protein